MNNNNNSRDNIGSIGIGAMIVFIALILVAAVASAVIIQTGEKLQQNAQQTGSDTQREIAGKISIKSVLINGTDDVMMYFESSPGSDTLDPSDLAWQVACTNDNAGTAGYQFVADVFGDGNALNDDNFNYAYNEADMGPIDTSGDGDFGDVCNGGGVCTEVPVMPNNNDNGDDASVEAMEILPGENYVIMLDLNGGGGTNDCAIGDLSINDEITLWIHVEGGGSTYETLMITDKTPGAELV
jgi:archaellin